MQRQRGKECPCRDFHRSTRGGHGHRPGAGKPRLRRVAPHASGVTHAQWHGRGWVTAGAMAVGLGLRPWRPGAARGPSSGLVLPVTAGAIIADQAYRPHPGTITTKAPTTGLTIIPRASAQTRARFALRNFRTFECAQGSTPPTPARSDCAPDLERCRAAAGRSHRLHRLLIGRLIELSQPVAVGSHARLRTAP